MPRKIAAQRSPYDRDIDTAAYHCLDQARGRIGLRIIAIDHEATDVIDDAFLTECELGRCVVAADQVHADFKLTQSRIGQRTELKVVSRTVDEDVGGCVIGRVSSTSPIPTGTPIMTSHRCAFSVRWTKVLCWAAKCIARPRPDHARAVSNLVLKTQFGAI